MKKLPSLPDIPEQDQTPVVKALLGLVEELIERVQQQDDEIALLKDEVNILKGEKKRPIFKGSKLDKNTEPDTDDSSGVISKKRPGSSKKKKTQKLVIHEDKVIKPDDPIPPGSRFKGYRNFVVQDLKIDSHNTCYWLEHWVTPQNKSMTGQLPKVLSNRHFGPQLVSYILYQYHHCQTTQPLLLEQLREWGIDISRGQINQLLLQGTDAFHAEKDDCLQAGLAASSYVTVDDSGARHQGKNGFVTHIGNDLFGWFQSTDSKSRVNFLELLRAGKTDYVLSEAALVYMKKQRLPERPFEQLSQLQGKSFANKEEWQALLDRMAIITPRHQRFATEGALLGSVLQHGLCDDLTIVSDDAGQFDILLHALCWVHTERLIHKMLPLNETHRQEIQLIRSQIWDFYAELKRYKSKPDKTHKNTLRHRFDEIFTQKTSYATLNQTLKRIHNNKAELLVVLDRPEIPLHTNGSETDIRDFVKKRKVSGGTRSDEGRRCRDTFASLKKTCRKLDISFWHYLTDRLGIAEQSIAPLSDIITERAALATAY
ncbi:MAG: transposase [Candidatus Brocadiaceae bacterium]|nr:transposase [Candidatus Brocadiaceae bacterium]